MTEVSYCTREEVKESLDIFDTARANRQIDRLIKASSRSVESGSINRFFYPTLATRYFDWPNWQRTYAWKLYLDQDLISATMFMSGSTVLTPPQYILRPENEGPPYTWVEVNLGLNAAFNSGASWQQSIGITGLWGYRADERAAGSFVANITTPTATTFTVTDSSVIGVGQLLRIDTERMIVIDKGLVTTGQTASITGSSGDTLLPVADGTQYHVGEYVVLDSETMWIVDIAGNSLIVKRAADGSGLAPHTTATVYARRSLAVERGVLGTTAATHTAGAIAKHHVPSLINQLTIGETLNSIEQERSAYARVVGSGDATRNASGAGLRDTRNQAYQVYARKARQRTV